MSIMLIHFLFFVISYHALGNHPLFILLLHWSTNEDKFLDVKATLYNIANIIKVQSRTRFLKSNTIDLLGQIITYCGRLFSALSDAEQCPWLLSTRHNSTSLTPFVITKNVFRYCQLFPWEGTVAPVQNYSSMVA